MDNNDNAIPLSESNITLKLADIQRRCSELMEESDSELELTLEEPGFSANGFNPYDHG